ncbi:hypothetical protein [Streptomyces olivochromogenes]
MHTPFDVHFGLAEQLREMRAEVLDAVYTKHLTSGSPSGWCRWS